MALRTKEKPEMRTRARVAGRRPSWERGRPARCRRQPARLPIGRKAMPVVLGESASDWALSGRAARAPRGPSRPRRGADISQRFAMAGPGPSVGKALGGGAAVLAAAALARLALGAVALQWALTVYGPTAAVAAGALAAFAVPPLSGAEAVGWE